MQITDFPGARDAIGLFSVIMLFLFLGLLFAAIVVPKTAKKKFVAVSLLVLPVAWLYIQIALDNREQEKIYQANQARTAQARAIYEELCKKSGVFIHRTVDDVEGFYLMKLRSRDRAYSQDFYDPYGADGAMNGDDFSESFLQGRTEDGKVGDKSLASSFSGGKPVIVTQGYRYVEAINPKDKQRYRYTGAYVRISEEEVLRDKSVQWAIERDPTFVPPTLDRYTLTLTPVSDQPLPRYAVTFDDISTPAERAYWIAGSSLRVIDLSTNEVIAERIGYMFDPAQGRDGWGSPWYRGKYNACPAFPGEGHSKSTLYQTRNFVERVLKPKQEY